MRISHPSLLAALGAIAAAFAGPAGAQVRTFANPTHEGFAVSYCTADRSVCGEQLATEWCRSQGFEYARDWTSTPGVDVQTATVQLGDGSICRGAQCEAFGSITCGREGRTFRMPTLGPAGRVTLISPDQRTEESAVEAIEYDVLIPGCYQREPGVFLCETVHDYQHCRTLLHAGNVFGCRAGLAFDGGFAEPVAASPDNYELNLKSSGEITVERGQRGAGRIKGDARFKLSFAPPDEPGMRCLQRDRYIYYPTGPKGGLAEIGDTAACDAPIEGRFAPHEDDLYQAYDLCESFDAWGDELDQPSELLVAALFNLGARPSIPNARSESATRIIASYLTIRAPTTVTCKD